MSTVLVFIVCYLYSSGEATPELPMSVCSLLRDVLYFVNANNCVVLEIKKVITQLF